MNDAEKVRFAEARMSVLGNDRSDGGIGTLSEKTLHRILKLYLEPDEGKHEIKFEGSVADIKNSDGIFEIQTRALEKLIPKLAKFLPKTKVTVVIPVITEKTVRWFDKSTGEISAPGKSPKHETVYTAMAELYKIRKFLNDGNLSVKLILMKAEDYRLLDGWGRGGKRGSTRLERIPTEIVDVIDIPKGEASLSLLPRGIPETFSARELASFSGFSSAIASKVAGALSSFGGISTVGKRGNAYIYKINK